MKKSDTSLMGKDISTLEINKWALFSKLDLGVFLFLTWLQDNWIRILSEPGDLIILPAGIYHRFTPDHSDYIHVIRMFKGLPKWEAHNRSEQTEDMKERVEYVQAL